MENKLNKLYEKVMREVFNNFYTTSLSSSTVHPHRLGFDSKKDADKASEILSDNYDTIINHDYDQYGDEIGFDSTRARKKAISIIQKNW